jgi:xanthine dehydrogenase accessory factor
MVIRPSGRFQGTIGGGALEWEALAAAQAALKDGRGPASRRSLALGPELAQCCGGRVEWRIETFDKRDLVDLEPIAKSESAGPATLRAKIASNGRIERAVEPDRRGKELTASLPAAGDWIEPIGESARAVYLFGAGHVGRALALALAPLPFAVRWIDSRREAFPAYAPTNVVLIHAPEPVSELRNAPDHALIVVMTHSHPLDLEIVAGALRLERFGYVGLIGSATKRARFVSQMRHAGLSDARFSKLVCPIGIPGIASKDPAVIAAATAAQLLVVGEKIEGDHRSVECAALGP